MEHQRLKEILFIYLQRIGRNPEVEKIVKNENAVRIADILIKNKVFEIQCSPITWRECLNRYFFWKKRGYALIWLFSEKSFYNEKEEIFWNFLKNKWITLKNIKLKEPLIQFQRKRIPIYFISENEIIYKIMGLEPATRSVEGGNNKDTGATWGSYIRHLKATFYFNKKKWELPRLTTPFWSR